MNAIAPGSCMWNLWHGCRKLSAGCAHCYVYRGDARRGLDSSRVYQTKNFDLPLRKKRDGSWKIAPGSLVYTCFTSDFFLEEADAWRREAWEMIRLRGDLRFMIITKRIDRLQVNLPEDWGQGWEHVSIGCTVENQEMADHRLPLFKAAPIRHKIIICEPLLGPVNLQSFDPGSWAEQVVAGGESGSEARVCHYDWVLDLRRCCLEANISFWFKQTGSCFQKDGKTYTIKRALQHSQARRAGINYEPQSFTQRTALP